MLRNEEYLTKVREQAYDHQNHRNALSACAASILNLDHRLTAIEQASRPAIPDAPTCKESLQVVPPPFSTEATLKCEGCGATFSEEGRPYRAMVGCRCAQPLVPITPPPPAADVEERARRAACLAVVEFWKERGFPAEIENFKDTDEAACRAYSAVVTADLRAKVANDAEKLQWFDKRCNWYGSQVEELKRELERANAEMTRSHGSLGRAEQKFKEQQNTIEDLQRQLASRPAPGEVPELTDADIEGAWNECVWPGQKPFPVVGETERPILLNRIRACIIAAFAKMQAAGVGVAR